MRSVIRKCVENRQSVLLYILLALTLTCIGYANDSLLEKANELAMLGKHDRAEKLYTEFLESHPGNLEALLQRGFVRSWMGNYSNAVSDFESILERHPGNVNALNGLGYTLAWSKRFDEAEEIFQKALTIVPGRFETIKGMAYNALWSGRNQVAVARFGVLANIQPENWQIQQALGQSYAAAGQRQPAIHALENAARLNPQRQEIRNQLSSLTATNALADIAFWGGYTNLDASNGFNLRAIEVAISPSVDSRLWFRYDNTLSLDNSALLSLSDERPVWWIGAFKAWSGGWISKIEVGARQVRNQWEETVLSFEQTKVFGNLTAIKAGGFFTEIHAGGREYTTFGGISQPLTSRFKIEPVVYYSQNSGNNDTAWRLLVSSQFNISPISELNGGVAFGQVNTDLEASSGDILTSYLMFGQQIFHGNRLFVIYRYESPVNESFSVFSVGLKMNLGRR